MTLLVLTGQPTDCFWGRCGVSPARESGKPPLLKKFHKADREKLRRDKLNEQFTELASVLGELFASVVEYAHQGNALACAVHGVVVVVSFCLTEPDRPKNDKATILGDSVQAVRDLRAELRRLKSEHEALLDETREVGGVALPLCPWILERRRVQTEIVCKQVRD